MRVLKVRNVEQALLEGIRLILAEGVETSPRGIRTLEVPEPVVTVYSHPLERVLFNSVRDANPFFHFFESLWIIAGRQDVEFLAYFNSNMRQFSDDGSTFHAPYGYRLRYGANGIGKDQFGHVVEVLKKDLESRQAVLQIWNAEYDLNVVSRDVPCNDLIFLKIREGKLNMTVCCRSNDILWGAYGANAVQFSVILEYLAARLGVEVGEYRQISDSYHVYPDNPLWPKLVEWAGSPYAELEDWFPFNSHYPGVYPLIDYPDTFDGDLLRWFKDPMRWSLLRDNTVFNNVAAPMYRCWVAHKKDKSGLQLVDKIQAPDWRLACREWLERREKR